MTEQTLDPENAARIARDLLEASTEKKVGAVRALVDTANALANAERGVKYAREDHDKAWAAAISSGWSDKELRATGVRVPTKTVAPSRARKTTKQAAENSTEGGSE